MFHPRYADAIRAPSVYRMRRAEYRACGPVPGEKIALGAWDVRLLRGDAGG